MDRLMIRYTVTRDELTRHLELIGAVYNELEATKPDDLRFATFQVGEDERSFVDIALGPDLPGPLASLGSFRRYRAGLDARCEERVASELHEVAAYRFTDPRADATP